MDSMVEDKLEMDHAQRIGDNTVEVTRMHVNTLPDFGRLTLKEKRSKNV